MCCHEECEGQTFNTTASLRRHLHQVHDETEEPEEGQDLPSRLKRKRNRDRSQKQETETRADEEEHSAEEEDSMREESELEVDCREPDIADDHEIESDCDQPWHCLEDDCERSFGTVQ